MVQLISGSKKKGQFCSGGGVVDTMFDGDAGHGPPAGGPPPDDPTFLERKGREAFLSVVRAEGVDDADKAERAKRFCVFDTETASLKGPVVQIAMLLCAEDGCHLASYECKYKFDQTQGIKWCDRAEGVHGLSRTFLDKHGIDPRTGLEFLRDILDEVRRAGVILVAHNYAFDKRMVNLTAFLNGFEDLLPPGALSFCTLSGGRAVYGKALRNEDLRRRLTGETHSLGRVHDALVDASITAVSYAAGRKAGVW